MKSLAEVEIWLRNQGFEHLDSGHSRSTWHRPKDDYVIKMPMFEKYGVINERERLLWETLKDERQAMCRMFKVHGITLLMMERVDTVCDPASNKGYCFDDFGCEAPEEDLPEWVDGIDLFQVGRRKDGTLVAFDYPDAALFIQQAEQLGVIVPTTEPTISIDEILNI